MEVGQPRRAIPVLQDLAARAGSPEREQAERMPDQIERMPDQAGARGGTA